MIAKLDALQVNKMWKNGQDTSVNGESVRLYQPILYSRKLPQDPKLCQIGGRPVYFTDREPPRCASCHDDMYLLVQLYNPVELKTLYVFSCNRASCYAFESKFSGGGPVCCQRSQEIVVAKEQSKRAVPKVATESPWDTPATGTDWDAEEEAGDNLESMIERMELDGPKGTGGNKPKKNGSKKTSTSTSDGVGFSCYEIAAQREPSVVKIKDEDDDDVGISGGASDAKIRTMLARYMEEEDDQEILMALGGGNASGGGGSGREKDERLSAENRALLTFTDRIKRAPRQVVRYAKGGEPLWSVPLPKKHQTKGKGGQKSTEAFVDILKVPACPCGAERVFECQLMPSLLHVLEVDKHAAKDDGSMEPLNLDQLMHFENGGQNLGAMAIYTCPNNCDLSTEEFVLVQESVDGKPSKRQHASMVVEVDTEGGDDDGETLEPYDGQMDDEPWSDEEEEMGKN